MLPARLEIEKAKRAMLMPGAAHPAEKYAARWIE